MVISQLTGGLGNQLFQYATGFSLAKRQGSRFAIDIRHFAEHEKARRVQTHLPSRPYALDRLCVSAREITPLERFLVSASRARTSANRAIRLLGRLPYPRLRILVDRAEGDDERLRNTASGAYLVGTWQTEKLFAENREALLAEFTFRLPPDEWNAELIRRMQSTVSISVHFRRTDYLQPGTSLRPCSLAYYERALSAMQSAFPGANYFVFTDDPDWVLENASLPPSATLITHNKGVNDAEDLRLMSHCRHFVIANSSFSWWGAWLARGQDKRVIAPAVWYENGHGSERDLVPAAWTRL